jgi:hypothetical protein
MNSRIRRPKTVIDKKQAISLLYPIAAFFSSGGMNRAESLAAFAAAFDSLRRSERKLALEHIGTSTCYLDLIATWSRDRKFLDSQGRPRHLPVSGQNGFSALVRSTGARQDPKELLRVLIRYKNVRRLRDGRLHLVSPLFRTSAGSRIAFEPTARFLSDASSTLTHILKKNASESTSPDLFWRSVESMHVSRASAGKFMGFAKERSLLFLDELDDWLQAHGRAKLRSGEKRLRVGLGLFSIHTNGPQLSPRQ